MSPLSGTVDQRLDASLAMTWRAARDWELAGRASGSMIRGETSVGRFWTGAARSELATADLRASWTATDHAVLSFGPAARWQRGHDAITPSFVEWGGVVELRFGARWPHRRDPPSTPEGPSAAPVPTRGREGARSETGVAPVQ